MKLLFENWQKFLKEDVSSGALRGTLAGIAGMGRIPMPASKHPQADNFEPGKDLNLVVKIVIHGNNMVLLLKKEKVWDLPGGHVKQGENKIAALIREIFEETGLQVTKVDNLNMQHGDTHFFSAEFLTDDVTLSDEHSGHEFVNIDKIKELDNLSKEYKEAIFACVKTDLNENKLTITLKF